MSACPFCRGSLRTIFLEGLEREECEACHAVWLSGGGLARVVGESELEALVKRARGKPGRCKHCQSALQYVPSCPSCGEVAPACPRCGTAPLAEAEVSEVPVDVCTGCQGVGLEEGKLERLQRAAEVERDGWLEEFHEGPPEKEERQEALCSGCGRKLKSAYAFEWEEQLWCGSCAPVGAVPAEVRLTRRGSSLDDPFHPLAGYSQRRILQERVLLKVESALTWFFSKVLG